MSDYPGEEWAESHESRGRETGVSEVSVSWAFRGWSLSSWWVELVGSQVASLGVSFRAPEMPSGLKDRIHSKRVCSCLMERMSPIEGTWDLRAVGSQEAGNTQ